MLHSPPHSPVAPDKVADALIKADEVKPQACSCGGTPVGKGRTLSCGNTTVCHRVVMRPTRAEAVEYWNAAVSCDSATRPARICLAVCARASGDMQFCSERGREIP